jgi:hypothetical protein
MGNRGPKPKGKVKIKWSPDFAYAIGLLVTDGCVSGDGRHIIFVSKDREQISNFMKCLNISNKIGTSYSGYRKSRAYRVQFGDVNFIAFLKSIGISPAKSLTISQITVPKRYFLDFLRGCFDGDGYSHSYLDKRWRSSFMLYVGFVSASTSFIYWLKRQIRDATGLDGHITRAYKKNKYYQLKYSKYGAVKLIRKLYSNKNCVCLTRKWLKIKQSLAMMDRFPSEDRYLTKDARVAKLVIRTTLRW